MESIILSIADGIVLPLMCAALVYGGTWFIESRFFEWLLELFFDF